MSVKYWKKPKLIVLVRNNPEQAVLTSCKGGGDLGASHYKNTQCVDLYVAGPGDWWCTEACENVGSS